MRNDVNNALKSSAVMSQPAVLSALNTSKTSASIEIDNVTRNLFTVENILNIVNTVNAEQKLEFENIDCGGKSIKDITQQQSMSAFVSALSEYIVNNSVLNKLDNKGDAVADSKTTNPIAEVTDSIFGGIAGIFGGMATPLYVGLAVMFLFIIIFVVVVVIGRMYSNKIAYQDYIKSGNYKY
jgi:hypothetical protein